MTVRQEPNKPPEDAVSALFKQGLLLHQQGRFTQAREFYQRVLKLEPGHFDALHLLGVLAAQTNDLERAVESITRAIELNPGVAEAHYNCGNALLALKRHEDALQSFDRAIALKPDYAQAYNNRGNALLALRRHEYALQSYDKAVALKPDHAEACINCGNALNEMRRFEEALQSYDKAIALKPDFAAANNGRGNALLGLNRHEEALASNDKAIALKSDYAEAFYNRGNTLQDLRRYEDALANYDKAIALKFDGAFLYGMWLHTKMYVCDWRDADGTFSRLSESIERGEKTSTPFPVLAISNSPALQRKAAEIFVRDMYPAATSPASVAPFAKHETIRIGYFSPDFRIHPVAYSVAELLERHDRTKVEVNAFSFGPRTNDEMQKRLAAAADRFIDVRERSDADIAMLARELEIDIAVDLAGFTLDSRPGIFMRRTAPIQVNYHGYPGTMGADFIDYLIADSTIIPETHQQHYAEKIAYLPDSFQANDTKHPISDRAFTRQELGLPPAGFVFCCFNTSYKILPDVFDSWMRILNKVDGSVLWLKDDETAARNLRREAEARGVAADRLVFAKKVPLIADHLARHRMADLFLDTLPYNAHSTASDALWAGLPVLTRIGETYAGRVAASLLRAIQLPELVTSTQDEYEKLAIALATNPGQLAQLKRKLERNRLTTPLFDIGLVAKQIERAFAMMYERHHAGLEARHLYVTP